MSPTQKKIGSVPYLNSVPLTYGIENEIDFVVPSLLAEKLRAGKLDAALVSITEALFHDGYEILDGVAIASDGPVKSVFLAHRQPLEKIHTIHCDTASLTSINLLRVLLAERDIKPIFKPLPNYKQANQLNNLLIIGNPAIDFLRAPHEHNIWDLGLAWQELTRLSFVYAVWALRRGQHNETLRNKLLSAKKSGITNLTEIIATHTDYDADFRKTYLNGHIRYNFGEREKAGLNKFIGLLKKHAIAPIFEPTFI